MSKQPPPAPIASAIGPCPIIIQIVGRPGSGSLNSGLTFQQQLDPNKSGPRFKFSAKRPGIHLATPELVEQRVIHYIQC